MTLAGIGGSARIAAKHHARRRVLIQSRFEHRRYHWPRIRWQMGIIVLLVDDEDQRSLIARPSLIEVRPIVMSRQAMPADQMQQLRRGRTGAGRFLYQQFDPRRMGGIVMEPEIVDEQAPGVRAV